MNSTSHFDPVFVDRMPPQLGAGKLYVSNTYYVTKHLCACGCAEVVTLPLHPAQWRYTFDGKDISIHPSVGNVGTPCNSHYWITAGRVDRAKAITARQAQHGRAKDADDLRAFDVAEVTPSPAAPPPARKPQWRRVLRR
jgi:hypothetical protein